MLEKLKRKVSSLNTATYFADTAFLPNGWAKNVLITVDAAGWITDVQAGQSSGTATLLNGPVLPGMLNVHSHAFQRAMAGLTERVTGEQDSFWTWRDIMYSFLQKLTPEDQQAIAAQLYVEMLKAGFTSVGEFHYVHHQPDGTPYQDKPLTSRYIIAAAKEAGIAITHLPVLYAFSGFGGHKPTESQKRFLNNETEILDIIYSLMNAYKDDPQVTIGLALHSLRAVSTEMLQQATIGIKKLNHDAPIHIHISEQMKEVNDCLTWSGKRPVEWLLSIADVNSHWCLVHATHLSDSEIRALAQTNAVVGVCPTTEANLGDGIFNLIDFARCGGRIGIGSDSHISVSVIEELRLLEYGQRLRWNERAVVKFGEQTSIGASIYRMALKGGAQALKRNAGEIAVGKRADFIALDPDTPTLLCRQGDFIIDSMIFAGNVNPIRHVIAAGKHIVKDYKHINEEAILTRYKKTIEKLE